MATKTLFFLVQQPPYKIEASKLAFTHAISSQSVEIYLEDDEDLVEAKLGFVGEGVLNCTPNHKSVEHYDMISINEHMRNALLVDVPIYICKEDIEKYGIPAESVPDAEDMGADINAEIVPFDDIVKLMDECDHVLVI